MKKRFILGITGSEVNCLLSDNAEQIKVANPHITDEEVQRVYTQLQAEIIEAELADQKQQEYEESDPTTED